VVLFSFHRNPIDSPDNPIMINDPDQIKVGTGLLNNNIREIATKNSGFNTTVTEGQDYSKLENARKLTLNEYSYNAQDISLTTTFN
jgi:hypothetical protein